MLKNYQLNGCMSAPGLAIGGATTTLKYANSVIVKANGVISAVVTTADAPALTTAVAADGTTPTTLAIDYCRIYTLLASVNATTGAITFSLAVGSDFPETRMPKMSDINFGNAKNDDAHKAVVGFIIITNTTNLFVPGTTALSAAGVTTRYFDNVISALGA